MASSRCVQLLLLLLLLLLLQCLVPAVRLLLLLQCLVPVVRLLLVLLQWLVPAAGQRVVKCCAVLQQLPQLLHGQVHSRCFQHLLPLLLLHLWKVLRRC
jgi:hypothetical protein